VYKTDLQTMTRVFFQQNVELRAEVVHIPGMQGPIRIRVTLIKGAVVACLIKSKSGKVLSGATALFIVERLGPLLWDYTSIKPGASPSDIGQQHKALWGAPTKAQPITARKDQVPTTQSIGTRPPGIAWTSLQPAQVPIRVRDVPQQQFAAWPRTYRLVFNLVDGRNSIGKIAYLLAQPYKTVASILADLHRQAIIDFSVRPTI
jgi:hypothetical protein